MRVISRIMRVISGFMRVMRVTSEVMRVMRVTGWVMGVTSGFMRVMIQQRIPEGHEGHQ